MMTGYHKSCRCMYCDYTHLFHSMPHFFCFRDGFHFFIFEQDKGIPTTFCTYYNSVSLQGKKLERGCQTRPSAHPPADLARQALNVFDPYDKRRSQADEQTKSNITGRDRKHSDFFKVTVNSLMPSNLPEASKKSIVQRRSGKINIVKLSQLVFLCVADMDI